MYLHIDSRNIVDSVLTLQDPIKNITRCSVYMAKLPEIQTERFLFIDIVELRSDQVVDTSSESLNVNKFVGVVPADGTLYKPSRPLWAVYQTPLDNIFKLTVRVTDYLGQPVDLNGAGFSIILELGLSEPQPEPPAEPEPPEEPEPVPRRSMVPLIVGGAILILLIILKKFR